MCKIDCLLDYGTGTRIYVERRYFDASVAPNSVIAV